MTKKNKKKSRKTKKKQTWASDQTFSEKFWFFGFLVFSRFRGTSQLFDFSLGEKPWENQKTSRKPKNQKPKLFRECLVWGSCLFFLVFLEFFGFLKELLLEVRQKIKKTQVFFWFFAWIVVRCLLKICPKTKKDLSFFGFFALLQVRVPSKNQKNLECF